MKVIAGKQARNYVLLTSVLVQFKPGSVPKKATDGGGEMPSPKMPAMNNKTELWVAEFSGVESTPRLLTLGLSAFPGIKDLPEKLKQVKGVGLESTMTQDIMGRTIMVTLQTVSLAEAPLPDSLFFPPNGWKQVPYEPPLVPQGVGRFSNK